MSSYRRAFVEGGSYFFTVVTFDRLPVLRTADNRLRR
jgi:REP element-mobilizing transposase RayT